MSTCRVLAPVMLCACLVLSSGGCGKGGSEDDKFAKLSRDFCEDYFRMNPVLATEIGEHRYDHRINDISRAGVKVELETFRACLERLERMDAGKLSSDNRIDAEVLEKGIKLEILYFDDLRSFETDPMFYTGLLGNSINYLIDRDFAPLDERLDAAVDRLGEFPRVIDEAMANLSNPPKPNTETAIAQNRGLMALIRNDLMGIAETSPRKFKRISNAAGPALTALDRFQTFLEGDLVNRSLGDSRLGDARYRRLIDLTLQSDMTSDEIVVAAYAEIDRVHDEMYELAARLFVEMNGGKLPAKPDAAGRTAIIKRVLAEIAKDHSAPGGLLDAYKAAYTEAAAFVREKDILTIPDEPLEIIWAPEYSRGAFINALEAPGPLDRKLKYYFQVSPVPPEFDQRQKESYLREYNNEMILLATFHEAMPGNFVQLAYANRNPSIVRAVFPSMAFDEGWAVYCMDIMTELGFHDADPKLRLQWQKYYLRVLTNAILDAGMHRQGMTEREAIELLTEDGFQEESEAWIKWRRVALSPGYLSTYFVGYLDMRSLRLEAEQRDGDRFRLDEFHEKLLSQGALPPRLARRALFGE